MLSDIFYDKLAPETRQQLRKLDCVLVKGSEQPITLWAPSRGAAGAAAGYEGKYFHAGAGQELPGATKMNQFTADYCTAIDNYMDGDWGAAKSQLEACADQEPDDQASKTILEYMASENNACPSDWQKCRSLTSK